MLDGKEVEGKIGENGSYSVDVSEQGVVAVEFAYEQDLGEAKVKTANSVSVSIFSLLEKLVAKTNATWDDQAVAGLKSLLGMK